MRIPFCPVPLNRAKKISKPFYRFTRRLATSKLEYELKVAEMGLNAREYAAITVFSSVFNSILSLLILFGASILFVSAAEAFVISSLFATIIFFMVFVYLRTYPRVKVRKKIINLERNLIHAVRHMYVMIRSGVSIFDSIVSVAGSKYGTTSNEFAKIVNEVNSGKSLEDALEEASINNPSSFFRRVIWQIINGIKSGSDISDIMESNTVYLSNEQRIAIKKYGAQLNPLSLMFMMFGIVIPTLGITFLIVLSILSGFNVTENILLVLLVFLLTFQFMLHGVVKSKRPSII